MAWNDGFVKHKFLDRYNDYFGEREVYDRRGRVIIDNSIYKFSETKKGKIGNEIKSFDNWKKLLSEPEQLKNSSNDTTQEMNYSKSSWVSYDLRGMSIVTEN